MNRVFRVAARAGFLLMLCASSRDAVGQATEPFLGQTMTAGFSFCPVGWALMDGQLMSISQNSALFNLLGTTYGGDGRTTFALPTAKPIFTASGAPLIGANHPGAHLHAETLARSVWDPDGDPAARGIMSLVAVHRLREVACLYGFTRFEPAPLATDELEDVGLAVSGAPLAQTPDWLPAVEQFGEGFFLQFSL